MKSYISILICFLCSLNAFPQKPPTIYIDKGGVMRWSDTRKEASFYGVNYTLPFAHAYRAMGYLGVERKKAIDRDVYHFARLGFNAYRIHIWDVEISDSLGNLLTNEHLDLLDYLIAKLKERNISIVITAQTNFGNGYPERNLPTGGYSYLYDKCSIHEDKKAMEAQERYLSALVQHVNTYTGMAYKEDPSIIGFEINNEPCHAGTTQQTKEYIDRMITAVRKAGNNKPIFYNVSHNLQVVSSYYDTDIQGTTYQWYPIGLVSGHLRKGNFLPYVDEYPIPFSTIKGFGNKARLVYEFDPADIMYSYMYPAIARTFRTAGFQWITQFAYDPMDMAFANTEYQTHYLNLAYTPGKAISMKIAAEVAYSVGRGEKWDTYPADTIFSHFRVSYKEDLSEMNTAEKFYYSNTTSTCPVMPEKLKHIAGCGSSPLVKYEGTGAYFIDQLEKGVWRLEVMPDAIQISDPFAKPSLNKEVVTIIRNAWDMRLALSDLGQEYTIIGLNENNHIHTIARNGIISALQPGVYLLSGVGQKVTGKWNADTTWGTIRLGEYVAPQTRIGTQVLMNHQPQRTSVAGHCLTIRAEVVSKVQPDSVIIYTDRVSFWNPSNPSIKMKHVQGYSYEAVVPASEMNEGVFRYNLIVCRGSLQHTFPGCIEGTPLNWNYTSDAYYKTTIIAPDSPIILFDVDGEANQMEVYGIPEYKSMNRRICQESPIDKPTINYSLEPNQPDSRFFLRKYIHTDLTGWATRLKEVKELCIYLKKKATGLKAGFVTSDGYTYYADCTFKSSGIIRIPLSDLRQMETALLPAAYPSFMNKYFKPQTNIPFDSSKIEFLELSFEKGELEMGNIWLE